MSFEITTSVDRDTLVVTFHGYAAEADGRAMIERYFKAVAESGLTKVLVDIRPLANRLSLSSTYFLVRNLPLSDIAYPIKTAVVDLPEFHSYVEFLQITAANAGAHFQHFFDYDEARRWLDLDNGA